LPRPGKPRRSLPEQLANIGNRGGWQRFGPKKPSSVEGQPGNWRRRVAPAEPQAPGANDAYARDDRTARLEAVLFLAREPINSRKLAQFAHLADGTEARTLVRRLNRWYDESGSAFRAEELAGGFQLMSRPKLGPWLRRLCDWPIEVRLSAPAQETLAVVAYRQPVLRAEIEAIRGVDCGEILRQLMDRDLVRTAGRANELGRPYRYATTRRFLQVFGLRHLDDLPRAELLRAPNTTPDQTSEPTETTRSRTNGIQENLTSSASEDEEDIDRDHHRPV
jgi:segregation and condensation protein B